MEVDNVNNTNVIVNGNQDDQSRQLAAQDAIRQRQEFLANALPEVIAEELLKELRQVLTAEYNIPLEALSQIGYAQAIDGRDFKFTLVYNSHSNGGGVGSGNSQVGNNANTFGASISKPNMNLNDYSILAHIMALLVPTSRDWMLSFFRTDISPEVRLQSILYLQLGIANGLVPIIDFLPWRVTALRLVMERNSNYWNNVNDKIIRGDAPVRRINLEYGGIVRGYETSNQINGTQSGNKLFRDKIGKTDKQRGVAESYDETNHVFSAYEILYRAANQVLNLEDRVGSIREYQRILSDLYRNISANPATLDNLMRFAQAANNRLQSLIGTQNSAIFGNALRIRYLARMLFNTNRMRVTQNNGEEDVIIDEMRDVDQQANVEVATNEYLTVASNNLQSLLDLNRASLALLATQREELAQELQRLELLFPQEARNPEQTEIIRRTSERLDQVVANIATTTRANEQITAQLETNSNLRQRRIRRAEEEVNIEFRTNNPRVFATGINNNNIIDINPADVAEFSRVVRQRTFDENLS